MGVQYSLVGYVIMWGTIFTGIQDSLCRIELERASYVVANKRHMRSKGKGKGKKQGPSNEAALIQNTHNPIPPFPQSEHTSQSLSSHEREVLPGVRRVWGTIRSCSVTSVAKAIGQLTNISGEMQVTSYTGKLSKWWYIVRTSKI